MKDEEMIFSVEFRSVKGQEAGVAIKAQGDDDFLLKAMADVLAGICAYTGCGADAIMDSDLGGRIREITKDLAHKAALKRFFSGVNSDDDDPIEEHVLAITPEMEAEAEEEEKRDEQKD